MQQQEAEWLEQVRQLHAKQDALRQQVFHKKYIQPVMDEVQELLRETGDSISPQGLERLAQWKTTTNVPISG
jgi:hypothetical protein